MFSKKPLFGIIFLVSLMLCIWSLPSVYGYWMYATKPPFVEDETKSVELKYFPLRGEDNIEDEGQEGETTQMDGLGVIIDALNNNTNNGSSTSKLNQYIDKRVKNFNKLEYGSVDVKEDVVKMLSDVTTMNPNFEFILSATIVGSGKNKKVESFCLYMINTTAFEEATQKWENSGLSESNYEKNPSIFQEYFYPVVRVQIEKDAYGQWKPKVAETGYTGYGYYEGSNNGGGQKVWTFDPGSWTAGTP